MENEPLQQYEIHPIANIFPMIDEEKFQLLKKDIAEHGQNEPANVWRGKLLDGRNRYRACQELGIELDCSELVDEIDPVAWVISQNLHRRHLETSQRAMIAARMANLKIGDNQHTKEGSPNDGPSSRDQASELLSVGTASIDRAKFVLANAAADLIAAVDAKKVTVALAEKVIKKLPSKSEQSKLLKAGKKAMLESVRSKPKGAAKSRKPIGTDERDDYDYPFVAAFEHCDYRLNTLQQLVKTLAPHEVLLLREWIASPELV